jgi:hypothetical protein
MIGAERSGLRARNVREAPAEVRSTFEHSPIVKAVRSLDAYPKVVEDYVHGSTSGGIITFVCAAICALLFLSEWSHHRTTVVTSEVKVDTLGVDRLTPNATRLRVSIDVTFHGLACELITLDTLDQAGEAHHDVHDGHLKKRRLDRHGKPLEKEFVTEPVNKHRDIHDEVVKLQKNAGGGEAHGGHSHGGGDGRRRGDLRDGETVVGGDDDEHDGNKDASTDGDKDASTDGDEDASHGDNNDAHRKLLQSNAADQLRLQMMNTFNLQDILDKQFPDGIEKAFRNENKEGCEVIGYLEVNRVPGSFSVSPGRSLQLGFAHVQLQVRTDLNLSHTINKFAFGDAFPGFVSPLDGYDKDLPPNHVHQYFLKVVPTSFTSLAGPRISSQQYSVTESSAAAKGLMGAQRPSGVYFHYELSPIAVHHKESRNSVSEFLTGVCAVVGGVATMSGLVHEAVQFAQSQIKAAA